MSDPGGAGPEYVAFDLETTGLSPASDRIVEIGAERFRPDGTVVDVFERLVNPLRPSSPTARAVHGIADETLAGAETADRILPDFLRFLGDPATTTLLAHNASFDAGFLGRELTRIGLAMPGHEVVDTLALARRRWPDLGSHKLGTLAARLRLDVAGSHRALADSTRVRGLWLALQEAGEPDEPDPLAYPIFDGERPMPAPRGWAEVARAIERDEVLRIEYGGGTRGPAPREVSPRGFSTRGGVAYLLARCHLDDKEKQFRLDRVRHFAILGRDEA